MINEIMEYNKKFVEDKAYEPYLTSKYPDKKLASLTCMDTRLTELLPAALGLKNGDAKIIKNAGGVITHPYGSVVRSLLVAIIELGVEEIMVIGHTDCGVQGMKQKPKRIFVVHGQDQVTDNFAAHLKEVVGVDAVAPYSGDIYDLQQNLCVVQGSRKLAEKRKTKKSGNTVFERLLAAGQRLIAVIHKNKEIANKDMAKFADQINALCDKWDR